MNCVRDKTKRIIQIGYGILSNLCFKKLKTKETARSSEREILLYDRSLKNSNSMKLCFSIKYICEFIRQLIETNHLEPCLRQERFVTAIKNAHVINLVEQHFSDFEKFKKDVEARSNELASKKRKKVSDNNDPDDESLRASSVSADVAGDDNTCCFRHFVASLGSAENEETSSSSHLPQIQAHVQQPASDENRIEKGSTEEDSHPTTDLGRKRGNSENEASEGDIYATAKPLQKRAKIGAAHAEVSTAENTGGSLQEYRSDIEHLAASPSVIQGTF
ncbi:hypothetical protein FOVG_19349 [Fusarium oxysporum f. sp. pisi HDV247]|uniref:Uncharacterized protein n=1 Tax=Fusarium oxysporum f. sp. pisi HDV247 TaxID=1080344 RepID=W9NGH7_FUSOX|nr:hypothetical protein FOVG_19349 [Fusarium oxysporum f. sp. pisi HDV247]